MGRRAFAFILVPLFVVVWCSCDRPAVTPLFTRASEARAGIDDAVEAVKELSVIPGDDVDALILQIVVGDTDLVSERIQSEAMQAAVARDISGAGRIIARKIVPHGSIITRQAAADALLEIDCDSICIEAVLYYLEWNWRGDANLEDWLSGRISERARSIVRAQQLELIQQLYEVLLLHSDATFAVLQRRYGIAQPVPSRFALGLIEHLRFSPACGALATSRRTYELAEMKIMPELLAAQKAAGCVAEGDLAERSERSGPPN